MMKIYLADLIYDTIKTNYVVPLNIAYLAANLSKRCGQKVEIKLFKYPKILEKALRDSPPDLLGLSNYSWNSRLNLLFLDIAKRIKPGIITVMGGPDIRTEPDEIKKFLLSHPLLDYYVIHEGEEAFANLVDNFLNEDRKSTPQGCATFKGGEFIFEPELFNIKDCHIDLPSPYLTGWLDQFLADPNMIPLIETNRGCPFGCVYCTWGSAALSRIRMRSLEVIYDEIDYISKYSAKQAIWIFCDANFGILPRDVDIATKIRQNMDRMGYPAKIIIWQSKNTTERNIKITEILGYSSGGYVAIQSADPIVLENIGRKNINFENIKEQVRHYKKINLPVATDILVGLPGESFISHLNTLRTAFDIGFDEIGVYNIRMLPSSKYESDEYRNKFNVLTKFRPIFGAYGIYDGRPVFELEESVRATKDMTEIELDNLKVIHWLIYFAWNVGMFKPMLKFGQRHGVNPLDILNQLVSTNNITLTRFFERIRYESTKEWFNTPEEMISFYSERQNFDKLIIDFTKLTMMFIALAWQDKKIVNSLELVIKRLILEELKKRNIYQESIFNTLVEFSKQIVCKDLLEDEFHKNVRCSGQAAAILMDDIKMTDKEYVDIEIYRPKEFVSLSKFYLEKSSSLRDLIGFLENGGLIMLKNKVRIVC